MKPLYTNNAKKASATMMEPIHVTTDDVVAFPNISAPPATLRPFEMLIIDIKIENTNAFPKD
jgi:hypothetical protein